MKRIKEEPGISPMKKIKEESAVSTFIASSGSQNSQVQPQPIPSRFTSGAEYENFFKNLVQLETDFLKNDRVNTHVWMSTSYDRQLSALHKFSSESSNDRNFLYKQILGTYVEGLCEGNDLKLPSVSSLPPLRAEQENVARIALQNRLTLIEGPSGSGKTITLASICYHLVQQSGPILVCAPTNAVVDHLALTIHKMKLKIVRLFAETRSSDGSLTHFLSLESQIRNHSHTEFLKLEKSCDESEKLSSQVAERLCDTSDSKKMMTERNILEGADVICCTCIGAGDERLSQMKFKAILIDDSMQATEPECIIPIALGCERLVLIGDPLQLSPIIKLKKAEEGGLKRSLFQRLMTIGVEPSSLRVQMRMHPHLWDLIPCVHYMEHSLPSSSGVSADERKLPEQALPWPNAELPFMFCDVDGVENRLESGSYINEAEASRIEQLVTRMLQRGIFPDRIGIITQYVGQKDYLMQYMEKHGPLDANFYQEIEVGMVDAFQGREKDVIIVSCVRSHGTTGLGSLGYKERFHLALTRAKFGLVIVGNSTALLRNQMWKNLLDRSKLHGVWR